MQRPPPADPHWRPWRTVMPSGRRLVARSAIPTHVALAWQSIKSFEARGGGSETIVLRSSNRRTEQPAHLYRARKLDPRVHSDPPGRRLSAPTRNRRVPKSPVSKTGDSRRPPRSGGTARTMGATVSEDGTRRWGTATSPRLASPSVGTSEPPRAMLAGRRSRFLRCAKNPTMKAADRRPRARSASRDRPITGLFYAV